MSAEAYNPMDELWRYAHDPDLLSADVARWAYDRIRTLEGAAGAGGRETGTQAPLAADVVELVIARFVEAGPTRDVAREFARAYIDGDVEAAAYAADIRATTEPAPEPAVIVAGAKLSPRALALLVRMAREFDTDGSHSYAETVMAQLLPLPDDVEAELLRVAIAHASAVLDAIRDNDPSLCDPNCPGRAGGPHQHLDPS